MEYGEPLKTLKDKKSTADQLKSLLGVSDDVDLLLAKHPNTSAETLDKLCSRHFFDEKIAPIALVHPNLNVEQLINVGTEYPLAAFKNPKFSGLVEKDKKFLDRFDGEPFEKSLKKVLPEFVVEWLLSRGNAEYQLTYISAPKRSPDELSKFRASKHPKVVASLLDKDIATFMKWAADVGFESAGLDQLPESEARSYIDSLISHVAQGTASSIAVPNNQSVELALPPELLAMLLQIEGTYFRKGRVAFGPEQTFYGDLVALLEGELTRDSSLTKLVAKVIDFDLEEMKRFANPGKKPPAEIAKASYYVKSGLERSLHRLLVAMARVYQRKPDTSYTGLSQALSQLMASNPLPERSSRIEAKGKSRLLSKLKDIDEATLLEWAKELGFTLPAQNDDEPVDEKWEFENWSDCEGEKVAELYKQLVPKSGHAESLQGELVRAISRLEYEYYQNDMMNWGDGSNFYENFAKLIHSTLKAEKSFSKLVLSLLDADIAAVKKSGVEGKEIASGKKASEEVFSGSFFVERDVERSHLRLRILIAKWCERNPSPLPYESTTRN